MAAKDMHASPIPGVKNAHSGKVTREWYHLLNELARTIDPDSLENFSPLLARAMNAAFTPAFNTYFRSFVLGSKNIPSDPALFVGVHGGGIISPDLVLAGLAFHRKFNFERPIFGLAHRMLFYVPVWNRFLMGIGGIAGTRENALKVLRNGHALIVYPGGEYDVARTFARRNAVNFEGRVGFVRVALEAGVPIVPVGAIGGQGTWFVVTENRGLASRLHTRNWLDVKTLPITVCLPWGLTFSYVPFLPLPARIAVAYGAPMHFKPSEGEKKDPRYHAWVRDTVQAAVRGLVDELLEASGHPGMGVGEPLPPVPEWRADSTPQRHTVRRLPSRGGIKEGRR